MPRLIPLKIAASFRLAAVRLPVLLLATGTLTTLSQAEDLGFRLRGGALYSDNVGRTPTNEVSAPIGVAGLQLWSQDTEGRLRNHALANLGYEQILHSDFSGYAVGNLAATADLDVIPETFTWNAKGSFQEIRPDLRRPLASDNRENVTTLGTGPTFAARFDNVAATLQGNYERTYFSESALDSHTVAGRFELDRIVSTTTHFGIGVSEDDVRYSSHLLLGIVDFTRKEAFADFHARGRRTAVDLELGAAQVRGSNFDTQGPLARIGITRRLSPYLTASVSLNRSFPTSPSSFSPSSFVITNPGAAQLLGVDASIANAAARRETDASVAFLYKRPRTEAELSLSHSTETGVVPTTLESRTFDEALLSVTHRLSGRVSAGFFGSYYRDRETSRNVMAHETSAGLSLGMLLRPSLNIEAIVQHTHRTDAAELGQFNELIGGVFLVYGSGPLSAPLERHIAE